MWTHSSLRQVENLEKIRDNSTPRRAVGLDLAFVGNFLILSTKVAEWGCWRRSRQQPHFFRVFFGILIRFVANDVLPTDRIYCPTMIAMGAYGCALLRGAVRFEPVTSRTLGENRTTALRWQTATFGNFGRQNQEISNEGVIESNCPSTRRKYFEFFRNFLQEERCRHFREGWFTHVQIRIVFDDRMSNRQRRHVLFGQLSQHRQDTVTLVDQQTLALRPSEEFNVNL